MNAIKHNCNGSFELAISKKSMENLKAYAPKGCPFKDYSMFDLLTDLFNMYSWRITRGKTENLSDFIRQLQQVGYAHAVAYGDAMIQLIEEV